jgi:hypothetical protein
MEIAMAIAKVCTKCKAEKAIAEFTQRRFVYKGVERWGYKSWCKPCHSLGSAVARAANPEKTRAKTNELYAQRMARMTAEEKEAHNAKSQKLNTKWRKENKERVKELKRRHREANKERIAVKKAADAKTKHGRALDRARTQRYQMAHPERVYESRVTTRTKRAPVAKEEARQKRIQLSSSYVAQMLCLPTAVVPPELIEAERLRIFIKRKLKELKNEPHI